MSTHDASLIHVNRSILNGQVGHELIHAICRENLYTTKDSATSGHHDQYQGGSHREIQVNGTEIQTGILVKEQLEVKWRLNAQLVESVGGLNFVEREDFGNLVGHEVDLDGVLADHPTIAHHVGKLKQEYAARIKLWSDTVRRSNSLLT
jgi:hypothetical protein